MDKKYVCEPCLNYGDEIEATQFKGWDYNPICDYHAKHSWSMRRPDNIEITRAEFNELKSWALRRAHAVIEEGKFDEMPAARQLLDKWKDV